MFLRDSVLQRPSRHIIRVRPFIGVTAALMGGVVVGLIVRRWWMPMHEIETSVAATPPPPIPTPDEDDGDRPLQPIYAGTGDLYHRRYQVDIHAPTLRKEDVMAQIYADINAFVPRELAYFEKTKGDPDQWVVGDEWFVHLTGPWDGPVRLIHTDPTMFAFITLRGHLEAGEIQFDMCDTPDKKGEYRFEIRSWARSSNRITDFFYRKLGLSKAAQTAVWTYFCNAVVKASGGEIIGDIRVTTHKTHYNPGVKPAWERYSRDFDRWRNTNLNFDPSQRETFTDKLGWRIDEYSVGLPSEPPGDPLPNGSWSTARKIVRNYEFPDPTLITGIFVPDHPLEERIMILRARFLFFTFLFGVKIVGVTDEIRTTDKRGEARVWGYGYRTLEGHFEMGEITFEVWKFLETGEVEFRVHAYSKVAHIRNPLYRLGFYLFGRGLQRRFARTAMQRMQQLVIARTQQAEDAVKDEEIPTDKPDVQTVSSEPAVERKAEQIQQDMAAAEEEQQE